MNTNLRRTLNLSVPALVTIATAFASAALNFPATGIDDADIFLVYARNVSAGDGFVFNPGGERVEGFTSLLWVLICTGAIAAVRNPERLLIALNILLVSLAIVYCLRSTVFSQTSDGNGAMATAAAAFVALLLLDFRYVTWNTIALMETALWGTLLTLATIFVIDGRADRMHAWKLAALVALIIATRPEGLAWAIAVCVLVFVKRMIVEDRARALAAVFPGLLAYALTAGALTVFRLAYFGMPLPNTYYAKVSPSLAYSISEGSKYLVAYLSSGPIPFVCLLALVVSLAHLLKDRFRDHRTLALTVLGLMGLAMPVLAGGDHFDSFRFYQSVYPILLLAAINCVRVVVPRYVSSWSQRPVLPAVKVVVAASILGISLTVQIVDAIQFGTGPLRQEFGIAGAGRRLGQELNVLFAELPSLPDIGTITVGGLKYGYNGHVIDLMGLNNTRMAHNGGDRIGFRGHAAFEKRTFYELKPPILVPLVQLRNRLAIAGERVGFVDLVLKGLLQDQQFQDTYQLAEVRRRTPAGVVRLAAWYDRQFLSNLARSGRFNIVTREKPRQK